MSEVGSVLCFILPFSLFPIQSRRPMLPPHHLSKTNPKEERVAAVLLNRLISKPHSVVVVVSLAQALLPQAPLNLKAAFLQLLLIHSLPCPPLGMVTNRHQGHNHCLPHVTNIPHVPCLPHQREELLSLIVVEADLLTSIRETAQVPNQLLVLLNSFPAARATRKEAILSLYLLLLFLL